MIHVLNKNTSASLLRAATLNPAQALGGKCLVSGSLWGRFELCRSVRELWHILDTCLHILKAPGQRQTYGSEISPWPHYPRVTGWGGSSSFRLPREVL